MPVAPEHPESLLAKKVYSISKKTAIGIRYYFLTSINKQFLATFIHSEK
jgi:hypothetical protein